MTGFYINMPSPMERGGLTAEELVYAHMPCYFGNQDCTTSKYSRIVLGIPLTPLVCLCEVVPRFLPDSCTLCWNTLGIESSCRQLPCGHTFHLACIDHWIRSQDASCPYCHRTFYCFRRPLSETDKSLNHGPSVLTVLRKMRLWIAKKLIVD
jgi:hypothetical protein